MYITNLLTRFLKIDFNKKKVTTDELDYAVHIGAIEGIIHKEEGDFIKNVMIFSKKDASNIMFPRNRALFIPYGTSIREAMDLCLEAGVIRAPVYQKDLDHVIGFIDSRELMPYILGYKKGRNINKFIRTIRYFPATRDLTELLRDFLYEGIQIAVVVDEYGGTAGLVTLNSILAELMGKDFKKWEIDYRPEVRRIDENLSIVNGDMQIHDFNIKYMENLASENSDTVGGYFIERVNRFPKRGDEIEIENYILRIKYIIKNRIESIEVARKNK
jgi:CBS domain containing-hemolysin-like protein